MLRNPILCTIALVLFSLVARAQQDIEMKVWTIHQPGKKFIKVKPNDTENFSWALTDNNEVYRISNLDDTEENYTEKFSAYNHLKFIDILAISKDTIFIATNSDKLLELKFNELSVLDQSNGVVGNINSIGRSASAKLTVNNSTAIDTYLTVATDNGFCYYDYKKNLFYKDIRGSFQARFFESSYRNYIMNDNNDFGSTVNADNYSILAITENRGYVRAPLFLNDYLGHNIRSVYITGGNFSYYNDSGINIYQYYATENGLVSKSQLAEQDAKNGFLYLPGKKINKISSIMGLYGFKDHVPGIEKENLLIGANDGLYFTQSVNSAEVLASGERNFTFTKFEGLDGIKVNDISTMYRKVPYWDGYCENYFWVATDEGLYLILSNRMDYLKTVRADIIHFENQPSSVKETDLCGSSVKLVFNNYPNQFVNWYRNGELILPPGDVELTVTQPGEYYAVLDDRCGSINRLETSHLLVNAGNAPIFNFNYPDEITQCDKTPVKLTVTANEPYTYRWYKNGIPTEDTGNEIMVTSAGRYKVEVSNCPARWIPAKEVKVVFSDLPVPVISAGNVDNCAGYPVHLSLNIPKSSDYQIHWYVDGKERNLYANDIAIDAISMGNYTVKLTNNTTCTTQSAAFAVSMAPAPQIAIKRSVNTMLCSGNTVTLTAEGSAGTVLWSTGQTTPSITVDEPGKYSVILTTAAGCNASDETTVDFVPGPVLNLADAVLCPFNQEAVTLTAPAGLAKYSWNGVAGTSQYTTSATGEVKLEVEDANGCKAEQTVNITTQCNDVNIPNAFTPNGDGINDTWKITGLGANETVTVKIYNRAGGLVYQSKGYNIAWDGTYNGKAVPIGVYYYIISTKTQLKLLSGSLTVLR